VFGAGDAAGSIRTAWDTRGMELGCSEKRRHTGRCAGGALGSASTWAAPGLRCPGKSWAGASSPTTGDLGVSWRAVQAPRRNSTQELLGDALGSAPKWEKRLGADLLLLGWGNFRRRSRVESKTSSAPTRYSTGTNFGRRWAAGQAARWYSWSHWRRCPAVLRYQGPALGAAAIWGRDELSHRAARLPPRW
jgi:hypothetical protein